MTATDDSLSAARLTDLVKRTLMVMFGRRPVSGTYTLEGRLSGRRSGLR